MFRRLVTLLAGAFCLAACFISFQLVVKHVTGATGPSWFEAGCEDSQEGGRANCAAVLASPYSFFPKKVPGELKPIPRVPVALLGWVYYSTMLAWLIGMGIPFAHRRFYHVMPLILAMFGLAASAYYTFIMFTKLQEWCPWCLATHVLNLLMFGCLVVLWRSRAKKDVGTPADNATTKSSEAVQPDTQGITNSSQSTRLALVTILMILAVLVLEFTWVALKVSKKDAISLRTCEAAYKRVTASGEIFLENWMKNPRRQAALRDDPPTRGKSSGGSPQVLVFSDFACPSCQAVSRYLESTVQPLFDGRLAISYRHYPLHNECNPETTATNHPNACFAARIAESAKMLGGNDAFWRAHDYLFENQAKLKAGLITVQVAAQHLQLEASSLEELLDSPTVAEHIASDAHMGRALGLTGTPTIFVDGRMIDSGAKMNLNFWNRVSDWYWNRLKQPRPASTLMPDNPTKRRHPIPDSPDQTGAR